MVLVSSRVTKASCKRQTHMAAGRRQATFEKLETNSDAEKKPPRWERGRKPMPRKTLVPLHSLQQVKQSPAKARGLEFYGVRRLRRISLIAGRRRRVEPSQAHSVRVQAGICVNSYLSPMEKLVDINCAQTSAGSESTTPGRTVVSASVQSTLMRIARQPGRFALCLKQLRGSG